MILDVKTAVFRYTSRDLIKNKNSIFSQNGDWLPSWITPLLGQKSKTATAQKFLHGPKISHAKFQNSTQKWSATHNLCINPVHYPHSVNGNIWYPHSVNEASPLYIVDWVYECALHFWVEFWNLAWFIFGPKGNFWAEAVFDFWHRDGIIQDGSQPPLLIGVFHYIPV